MIFWVHVAEGPESEILECNILVFLCNDGITVTHVTHDRVRSELVVAQGHDKQHNIQDQYDVRYS